jgi:hypothetical protein
MTKPIRHGEHAGYSRGCRCEACALAHRIYNRERLRVIRRYEQGIGPAPVSRSVSPDVAQRHLLWLKEKGLSINAVALRSGINEATLKKIRSGRSKQVWRTTEAAILRVRPSDYGPKQMFRSEYCRKIAKAIRDAGYTVVEINQMMGRSAHPSPLIRGKWIRIETQEKWEALYLGIFKHPAPFTKPTETKLRHDVRKGKV